MQNLIEDGNVSQGAAMDLFATLFVVFILILVVSMVLYGGYAVDDEKSFVYMRFDVQDMPATKHPAKFQLHIKRQDPSQVDRALVIPEAGGYYSLPGSAVIKPSTLGAGDDRINRAFVVKGLPRSRYDFEVVLSDGLEDVANDNARVTICWELFQPLDTLQTGCEEVSINHNASTLFQVRVDHDLKYQ